jgi:carbamoyltransferase
MQEALLRLAFSEVEKVQCLAEYSAAYEWLSNMELYERVADAPGAEKVIGWFQGRMEFGPRVRGAHSILGDARSPNMQSVMNREIKFRESFRCCRPRELAPIASHSTSAGHWP